MLRNVLLALAALLLLAGIVLCLGHVPAPGVQLVLSGAILMAALVFERWRYRGSSGDDDAGWEPTGERFEDPETHRTLAVQFHPATGERRYVACAE